MERDIIEDKLKQLDYIKFGDYMREYIDAYMRSCMKCFDIEPSEYGLEGWKNKAKSEYIRVLLQLEDDGYYIVW